MILSAAIISRPAYCWFILRSHSLLVKGLCNLGTCSIVATSMPSRDSSSLSSKVSLNGCHTHKSIRKSHSGGPELSPSTARCAELPVVVVKKTKQRLFRGGGGCTIVYDGAIEETRGNPKQVFQQVVEPTR